MNKKPTGSKRIDVRVKVSECLGKQNVSFVRVSDGRVELTGFSDVADALAWNKDNDASNTYGLRYRVVA